jgi:hypothetical protein
MSSHFFESVYTYERSSRKLDPMTAEKLKLLTVKFPIDKLAAFYASIEILDNDTPSARVRKLAGEDIATAKKLEPGKFEELVALKKREIIETGKRKAAERKRARRPKKDIIIRKKRSRKEG